MTNDSNIDEEKLRLANGIVDAIEQVVAARYPEASEDNDEDVNPQEILLLFILTKIGFEAHINTYDHTIYCRQGTEFSQALEDELNDALNDQRKHIDSIYKKHLGDDYMSLEAANELIGEALNAVDSVIKI